MFREWVRGKETYLEVMEFGGRKGGGGFVKKKIGGRMGWPDNGAFAL